MTFGYSNIFNIKIKIEEEILNMFNRNSIICNVV